MFIAALPKLNRAQARLNFAARIVDWGEPEPYELVREEQTDPGNYVDYVYRVKVLRAPPLEASVTIGEVLYNIHSALDHLANRLAERGQNGQRVTFPIFKNRAKFWRKDRDGNYLARSGAARLMLMPKDAWGLVEDVQPYKRGNDAPRHPLWLLHELSNADKHHALHLVGSALTDTRLSATGKDTLAELRDSNLGPFQHGDVIGRLRVWITGSDPQIKLNAKFATAEALAEPGPAAGEDPVLVLRDILAYVVNEGITAGHGSPHPSLSR